MSGAESALLGSLVASLTSLAALALSRCRIRRVPDPETGEMRCLSACSETPLVDSEELHIERFIIGDKELLVLSSKK